MYHGGQDQDWKTVIIKKHQPPPVTQASKAARSGAHATFTSTGKPAWAIEKRVDDPDSTAKPVDFVGRQLGSDIARARASQKLSQVDLANTVHVQKNIIEDIERGTAVLNKPLIAKIRKTLKMP